ncbi:unnamed protein product [Rotaria magnacalcarata]
MHIHRHHKLLLRPSLQQQDYNISTLSIQQPDTAATNDVMYGNDDDDDDNGTKSNNNPDDLVNEWKIPIWNNCALDDKVNLYSVQQQYTRFLLEMREQHILPQMVIQSITTHIVNLLDVVMDFVEEKAIQENVVLQQSVTNTTTTTISIVRLRDIVKQIEESIVLSTRNEYQFIESFRNRIFILYIDQEFVKKNLEKDEMISLLLENIQNNAAVTHRDPDLMFSFRDGIKGGMINKKTFLIQLYIDGIGVTNPLGPKKDQHKLTLVYFTLEDIPDIFRSMLQCIHLVAICNTKYLNDDMKMKKFYDPIINDLNDLQSSGLILNTFNSQIYFTFTTMAADNLAAHEVGGFQQSFSSGYICRRCLITYENRLIPLTDVHFVRRAANQHQRVLQSLENNPQIKSICGIVGPSPLNDLRNFNSSSSLPGDVMHDFFEGVCPLIIMAMLKEASSSRLITYAAIQTRTENFIYGALDTSNKPPPIQVKHLNNDRISGTASQKFCLFRLFPIIFSDIVDRLQLFKIYLILRELLDMVLALPQRKSWIPFMEMLAINFHCMMIEMLPDKVTPKVHYVTEYTRIIEENGPPVKYWCMRYEGAHLYFKRVAMQSYNFKNIPKTLAKRQQLRQCFLLSQHKFLNAFDEASGSQVVYFYQMESKIKNLLKQRYGQQLLNSDITLFQYSQLIHNHIIYKQHALYVYDLAHVEEIPLFFQIIHIFKLNQNWIFIVDFLNTEGFITKLWSYKVSSSDRLEIISPNDLKYYHKGIDLYKIDHAHVVNLTSRLTKEK